MHAAAGAPKPEQAGGSGFKCLSPALGTAVEAMGLHTPTEVQNLSIPALLESPSADFLLASHTGSGKTLAYLLPTGGLQGERGGGRCSHLGHRRRCALVS